MKNWEHYGKEVQKGPASSFKIGLIAFFLLFAFGSIIAVTGWVGGWFTEAARVTKQEFGPQAILAKYEWFKDASAALDKKLADIDVYQARFAALPGDRSQMDRADKEQYAIWSGEVAGVTASYNSLAAQWNAQISKFNWKPFLGDLPPGAEELLTKEYAPYRSR